MKKTLISSLAALGISVLSAGAANATTVAGWDFSQYLAPGALTINGVDGTNVLNANYSNLDPTGGAGAESAAYGKMFMDGSFGSTNVDPFGAAVLVPDAGSLASNLSPSGIPPFDTFTVLVDEGQQFTNLLSMKAVSAVDVVFSGNLSTSVLTGQGWSLSLGGRTDSGTAVVGVSFSTNGSTYTSAGSFNLTTVDTPFSVALGAAAAQSDLMYVKLSFSGNVPTSIDNLALGATLVQGVPEPVAAVLLGAGLAVVGALRRRSA
jgi:hypothetical protein